MNHKEGWLWLRGFLCRSYGTFLLFFLLKGLTPLAITYRPYGTCMVFAKKNEYDFFIFWFIFLPVHLLLNKRTAVRQ